ncbi:hypothetical protein KFK09_017185 [Dendrobium nobile]|uniref:Uncharacterized protein n=1 Tax=Dendrobium nobile TaxID=94219 RepID=A0A8T3B2A5_DENNO|nr:hypothetical protein KFK09_017185 [Dendrobium nobile]
MGSFLSSTASVNDYSVRKSKIMVIAADGSLHVHTARIAAAVAVAGADGAICDAEKIVFDAFPPVMSPDAELEVGKLYFVLEAAEVGRRVTGADMVAMATKASMALRKGEHKRGRGIRRTRVMPAVGFGNGEIACGDGLVEKKKSYLKNRGGRLKRMLSTVDEADEE